MELWEADQVSKNGPIPSAYESIQNRSVYEVGIPTRMDVETDSSEMSQHPSVQVYVTPVQNETKELKTPGNIFQSWPDSDFTGPWNERARRLMSQIKDEDEAQKCCDDFRNEKIRRLKMISDGK